MLIPVMRVECPTCRSSGLVFAFKYHSGKERRLCCRCGLVWSISPRPACAPLAHTLQWMSSPPAPPLPYVVPTRPAPPPGDVRWTSTVVGTYIHTSCQ
jgi:hypothetical protein